MKKNIFNYGLIVLFILSLSACGTTKPSMMESGISQVDLENQLAEAKKRESEAAKLKSSLAIQEQQVEQRQTQLAGQIAAAKEAQLKARAAEENAKMGMQASPSAESLLPPNAKAGECYARVFVPNTYKKVTETVLKHAASERIETSPPKYQTVEETKLAKEASERLEVVPATYGWVTEEVMVTPASYNLIEVPATYETVTEKILVREAHLEWKKGSGPIQKINEATGEIMCLVRRAGPV